MSFNKFKEELEQLCKKHRVFLHVSEYDSLQVSNLTDQDELSYFINLLEDLTNVQVLTDNQPKHTLPPTS